MNIISMNNDDYEKSRFFDILIQKKTYSSMLYSLFAPIIYTIVFVFLLAFFLTGIVLSPLYIGLYILKASYKLLWYLGKKEGWIIEKLLKINIPRISTFKPDTQSVLKEVQTYFKNKRSWKRLFYFFIKPIISVVFSIPVLSFLTLITSMVYIPISSVFDKISFFGLYETDEFIEVIFIYFISFIILVSFIHLILWACGLSVKFSKLFLSR